MAQRLASESKGRFAAIVCVVGGMAESVAKDFGPPAKVAVMVINGVDDPLVPYKGGKLGGRRSELGRTVSVDRIIELWVKHNGCATRPKVEQLPDNDSTDGTKSTRLTYRDSKTGKNVVLIKIDGGGHNWPGTRQYAPEFLIGKTCRDFDGTEMMLEFFGNLRTSARSQ